MAPFRILIIEDELLIAEMLKEMLLELGYEISGIAQNYAATEILLSQQMNVDLCFVDINLEQEKSGFDVVQLLKEKSGLPFVFLTSYSDKKTISQAVTYQPEAYLVKPFTQTDLFTTVEIIRSRTHLKKETTVPKTILIRDGNLSVRLNIPDIHWLKSDNIYVEIKTPSKIYLVRNSLERFLEELDDSSFVRTHRSFAVNLNHVRAVSGQFLLIEAQKIPLSRKYRSNIHFQFKA